MYFADGRWWEWHNEGIARPGIEATEVRQRFRNFAGIKVSIEGNESFKVTDTKVLRLRNVEHIQYGMVLSNQPNALATGRNSGFQAINLAVLAGAARILLLGYDMKAEGRQMHWFGDHPQRTAPQTIAGYRDGFNRLARVMPKGLQIINCSRDTALQCFPRAELESALPDPQPAVVPA